MPRPMIGPVAWWPERRKRSTRRRLFHLALATGTLIVGPAAVAHAAPNVAVQSSRPPTDVIDLDAVRDAQSIVGEWYAGRVGQRSRDDDSKQTPADRRARDERMPPIAEVDGLRIASPSAALGVVGFHEAGSLVPLALEPVVEATALPEDLDTLPPRRADVAATEPATTLVLPTRQRGTGPTTAVDLAIPRGEAVYAPVSGRVAEVNGYSLYGQMHDIRIAIEPADRPDLRVILIHVEGAQVRPGDRVVAGETVLAESPRPLPFESQIDRFTRAYKARLHPHVHMEVVRVARSD